MNYNGWFPEALALENVIYDALFDPASYDMPDFYCPSGNITGIWRICHVYKYDGKWWTSDGLDRISDFPIMVKILWVRPIPEAPAI